METALELAAAQTRQAGGSRVHRLRLKVGVLSGVVPEALRFAFQALSPGTVAEGARLEIIPVPARHWCRTCRQEFENIDDMIPDCPRCRTPTLVARGGRELELDSLEVS